LSKLHYIIILFFIPLVLFAQQKPTVHRKETWSAIFLHINLNKNYSLWNDFHFVPSSFFIARHGITRQINEKVTITGGYAWLLTATHFTDRLVRFEHRPWGQIEMIKPLSENIIYRFRLRYDFRIRKRIGEKEVMDDFIHYSRIRFMNGIRFPLIKMRNEKFLNINLINETLFNFGKEITGNNLDQNRIWILLGYNFGKYTLMPGYEQRFLPGHQKNTIMHGLAIWIILG
jgi:hypothetical protein